MTLDNKNQNHRNLDTQIALKNHKKVLLFNNFSRFEDKKIKMQESKNHQFGQKNVQNSPKNWPYKSGHLLLNVYS